MAAAGGKVPLSGEPWDNREMTSTLAHLTRLCNLGELLCLPPGVSILLLTNGKHSGKGMDLLKLHHLP